MTKLSTSDRGNKGKRLQEGQGFKGLFNWHKTKPHSVQIGTNGEIECFLLEQKHSTLLLLLFLEVEVEVGSNFLSERFNCFNFNKPDSENCILLSTITDPFEFGLVVVVVRGWGVGALDWILELTILLLWLLLPLFKDDDDGGGKGELDLVEELELLFVHLRFEEELELEVGNLWFK